MKDVVLIERNITRWQRFEKILLAPRQINPDELASLFIQLTDDLAYARTFYPKSDATRYLNQLALKSHLLIYKNKRERSNRIIMFWTIEFPLVIKETYRSLLWSTLIFLIAGFIGALSAANDSDFVRLIMGDEYVNKTLYNIENKDPMAVYKSANEMEMFLGITINNIRVAFYAFVMGLLISLGTGYILFHNGIMIGSFLYFMYFNGVFYEANLAIWMHGTIEIFSILVAGAAGLEIGNSILFPQTYRRIDSFKMGAKKGLKMVIGLVPFFIAAGFIEGFITRYTHAPDWIRLSFIGLSVILIIWYFFIYPVQVIKKLQATNLIN